MPTRPTVSVTLVTYNSRRFIERCLDAVLRQQGVPLEIVVVDNASGDGTREVLERFRGRLLSIFNAHNLGFAAAQNQAISLSRGDFVLTLNPDVLLMPGFIAGLVRAAGLDPRVGTVCGKLLSIGEDFRPPAERRIDSTGIYFTPQMRHFDRGWHEPDDGRYEHIEYVFGASAAAALYRREMIADVSVGEDFFDPDFFAYREDADLAWRAQLFGWRCLYTPEAEAFHVRRVVPGNRHAVPAVLNMHSVKNRFLMRVKNITTGVYRRYWMPATARDLLVLGGCLLYEPTSLPAIWHAARCLPGALRRRRHIMSRRRVTDQALARWFDPGCEAERLPELATTRPAVAAKTL